MKIISTDTIDSMTATGEDSAYPLANVLDDSLTNVWKSGGGWIDAGKYRGTITLVTDGSATDCIALFGLLADECTISVYDQTEATQYDTETFSSVAHNRLWMDFTSRSEVLHILIDLTSAVGGADVEIGAIRCGLSLDLPNPLYDVAQSREDKSIHYEMADGSLARYDRAKPRTMDLTIRMSPAQWIQLDAAYDANGQSPLAMDIFEDITDRHYYTGYFHMTSPPNASRKSGGKTTVSVPIREAV